MGLFRRRRPGRHAQDRDVFVDDGELTDAGDDDAEEDAIESFIDGLIDDDSDEPRVGPFDEEDAPDDDVPRVDLGSLRVPLVPGVELRLYPDTGIVEVTDGQSGMQMAAYAAPRSSGIWDEVRADLISGIGAHGGRWEEVAGDYGVELRARIRTEQGPTAIRIVGVDGPRWFVQAEFRGPAATDPTAGASLLACLQGLIVVRGKEARPVREMLPVRPPRDLTVVADDTGPIEQQRRPAG